MSDRMNKNSDLGIDMKKSYDALHAPDFLKKETLLKMQEAEEQNVRVSEALEDANVGDKSFYYKNKKTLRIVAGLSTVCAAAACFLFVFLSGTPYVTKMDDGMHYDTVELKNGEINFVSKRMAISISPNAGNAFDSVGNAEEAEGMEELINCKSGGTLTFAQTKETKLPKLSENDWSYIDDCPIYVTELKTEPIRYQAVYELDGETYELIGEGVTQKEFVDELYRRIKK